MSTLSCHVLDTSRGVPATGIPVALYSAISSQNAAPLATAVTNDDGRAVFDYQLEINLDYSLRFDSEPYCRESFGAVFFPFIEVHFRVADARHHHIPVLMAAHSYTTYRGS